MPQISVIVPVYKVEAYLDCCIKSILEQTFADFELILVDDGSPDRCPQICDDWAQRDTRIQVIHKQNGGSSEARNVGIEAARGRWIAFLDADDWLEKDFLKQMLKEVGPQKCDIYFVTACVREAKRTVVKDKPWQSMLCYVDREERERLAARALSPQVWQGQRYAQICTVWNKLYSAEFLRAGRLRFDERLLVWEDAWFNFLAYQRAHNVLEGTVIGYHYRLSDGSISRGYDPRRPEKDRYYMDKLYGYLRTNAVSDVLRQAIYMAILTAASEDLRLCYLHPQNRIRPAERKQRIRQLKAMPCVQEALASHSNAGFDKKRLAVKYLLKQPFYWPIELAYAVERAMRSTR